MTGWPRSSTTHLFAPPMACWTRPPARCARSARSAGGWTCAVAPARACGSLNRCAGDRSRASTSARACSPKRAVRTLAPGGYGPTSGPCRSPGPSTWRSASGRSGTSCPPNGPRCSPACTARCGPAGFSRSRPARGARHLRLVLGTARVRPGHAGPQCRVASPVRHVLPHLPAARGPGRPDRSRIHRDDSPPDGSGPARGRQPAVPACPRAQSHVMRLHQRARSGSAGSGMPRCLAWQPVSSGAFEPARQGHQSRAHSGCGPARRASSWHAWRTGTPARPRRGYRRVSGRHR